MTEIYLIRHCQAEGNRYHMIQGHWDGDVTALGRRQIDALAERFRTVKLDALYSSDLCRARLTASALSRFHALPIRSTAQLREIHMGRWETKFFGNLVHEEPELAYAFLHEQDKFAVEGGETYAEVAARACAALEEIARAHPGQAVAVVSHGITIRCILSRILDIPLRETGRLPIGGNTAVTHLFYDGGRFTADYLNDCSHLDAADNLSRSWGGDLRDEPLDAARDREYYCACYADSWRGAHGSLEGFFAGPYWDSAVQHLQRDPRSVLRLYHGDAPAGLVDLDTRRGAHAGYGWISLLYLHPEYRAQGYGIQLLARAILHYRALGRRALRLHAAEVNAAALAFYEREGFRTLSYENGNLGRLLLMERPLEGPRDV